ncbi:hypothetical protein D3C72_1591960 [compost metagenome]
MVTVPLAVVIANGVPTVPVASALSLANRTRYWLSPSAVSMILRSSIGAGTSSWGTVIDSCPQAKPPHPNSPGRDSSGLKLAMAGPIRGK